MNRVLLKWMFVLGILLVSFGGSDAQRVIETTIDGEKQNITLTGIPQIDYVWDPNLPRELNGYNLSSYPFLNGMPKVFTFKCDDMPHDGFYADQEFNCQVYHQCLHGIRYDFLCANFTSFDQRNFICQFTSEVDCPNSHLFWAKNEDLYKGRITTTETPPPIDHHLYDRPRRPHAQQFRPSFDFDEDDLPEIPRQTAPQSNLRFADQEENQQTDQQNPQEVSEDQSENNQKPGRGRGRPGRNRNRPNNDRRWQGGPRRRPRPKYYDDYSDDFSYDDVTGNEYDYEYERPIRKRPNRLNNRPGQRPREGNQRDNSVPSEPTQTSTTAVKTEATQRPSTAAKTETSQRPTAVTIGPQERSIDVDASQDEPEQILPTAGERRKLFQQIRAPSKGRPPIDVQNRRTSAATTTTTTTTQSPLTKSVPEDEVEYYYDYEYEDEVSEGSADVVPKTTTTKPEPVPKLQPAFRRAGLPERQVRTEEPAISLPQNKEVEAEGTPGAAKLRNRLHTLRVSPKEQTEVASLKAKEEPEMVDPLEPEPVPTSSEAPVVPEKVAAKPITNQRRLPRPPSRSDPSDRSDSRTDPPRSRNTEITTFRRQRSRRFDGIEELSLKFQR